LEILIRRIFCAYCLTGLNLFEVELPEQNQSVIPCQQEFRNFEGIDELKMVTVMVYHECVQQSAV